MNKQIFSEKWIVITTINQPTEAVKTISKLCKSGWSAVVVGDTKTPKDWSEENIHFLSVEDQKKIFGNYSEMIPYKHYCRKNLGYLFAIYKGAQCILETDDDNIPYSSFGNSVERKITGKLIRNKGWVNVYKYFTDKNIWPRGLPLNEIHSELDINDSISTYDCPIQQYLADEDPDVDAIYRLVYKDPLNFAQTDHPVILSDGSWVPFNSQNTLFFKDAFPLLYLPCHVSFRMTDIWRSFVAQIALWIHGHNLVFHSATVKQLRNTHDLMKDFSDEIIGYIENKRIADILEKARVRIEKDGTDNIITTALSLWKSLADAKIIQDKEIVIIENWFDQIKSFYKKNER